MSSITAYYQEDGFTIYHGDCREILPYLTDIDIVLTDPPYGMNYVSDMKNYIVTNGIRKRKAEAKKGEAIVGDSSYPLDVLNACIGIASKAVLTFCRWENLADMPKPKSLIAWVKRNGTLGDLSHEYGRAWEAIAFYPNAEHRFSTRPFDVIQNAMSSSLTRLHPTEKPVALLEKLLIPNEGDVILDPFMGSGATLRAAKNLGRQAIGIEVEEKYCEIAANRMRQTVMDLQAVGSA
jgi:site-specific DNA-methyltransferase (adenine-specific)